jgi:hypothetical protein
MLLRTASLRLTMQFGLLAFILISCICKLLFAAPTTSYENSCVQDRPYEELEPIERENWLPNDPQVSLKDKRTLSEVHACSEVASFRKLVCSLVHL